MPGRSSGPIFPRSDDKRASPSPTGETSRSVSMSGRGAIRKEARPAVGAMASGAWRPETGSEDSPERGRARRFSGPLEWEEGDDIGDLPARSATDGARGRRDSSGSAGSRPDSLVRRLSAGIGKAIRARSGSRERSSEDVHQDLGSNLRRERSSSSTRDERGRDLSRDRVIATGRGGAGNIIRSPSRPRGEETIPAVNPAAEARINAPHPTAHVTHSGRGGAGNVRSPSRDPLERKRIEEARHREHELQQQHMREDMRHAHTTGRGGAGNISGRNDHDEEARGRGRENKDGPVSNILRSLSRSRSREAHSRERNSPTARSTSRPRESLAGTTGGSKLAQVDEAPSSPSEARTSTADSTDVGHATPAVKDGTAHETAVPTHEHHGLMDKLTHGLHLGHNGHHGQAHHGQTTAS